MTRVVLGVSGGIAAYKAAEILRLFTENGNQVRVIPTPSSLAFVGTATWEALSGQPATTDVFENVDLVEHVRIGQHADLVLVAPATADVMARAAAGMAGDLLTSTLLTARCPVMFAPAMHTEMWEHAATRANVETLRARGCYVMEPAVGRLTGVDSGAGRLPEPQAIFQTASNLMHGTGDDLAGVRVTISAGGTREYLDPVRFLGNSSSGRQGYALAASALARGADVTIVAANVSLDAPSGARVIDVSTGAELRQQMQELAPGSDVVIMAAAVADYTPIAVQDHKVKKSGDDTGLHLDLTETPDILAELVTERRGKRPVIVGFAAETGDENAGVLEHGRDKLRRKACDYLVVNDVSAGKVFGSEHNEAVILGADGTQIEVTHGLKIELAHALWDRLSQDLAVS